MLILERETGIVYFEDIALADVNEQPSGDLMCSIKDDHLDNLPRFTMGYPCGGEFKITDHDWPDGACCGYISSFTLDTMGTGSVNVKYIAGMMSIATTYLVPEETIDKVSLAIAEAAGSCGCGSAMVVTIEYITGTPPDVDNDFWTNFLEILCKKLKCEAVERMYIVSIDCNGSYSIK